ncbi:MAG: HlyD family efflux transporter periplasmic adaptor subunit [Planctomycetota bacterium]
MLGPKTTTYEKRKRVSQNATNNVEGVHSVSEESLVAAKPLFSIAKPLFSFAKLALALLLVGVAAGTLFGLGGFLEDHETAVGMTHRVSRGDLIVTIQEQGILESEENFEIKSKVRGHNAVLWIIDSGSFVKKGDELVRLDSLFIQEQVDERTKYANWSQSGADHSAARLARAELAVEEYDQGRFRTEVMSLEKDIAVSKSSLQSARDRLKHSAMMASSGFVSELEIEERQFAVEQAALDLKLKETQLNVLKDFTYKEQLQTLKGEFTSTKATHEANVERAMADASRRDRAVAELQYCVLTADRDGLVIHPNAAKWESGPIAEGTNVHKDQVLLLMPDLNRMQVKFGVHESSVKRVKNGQQAKVTLTDGELQGSVSEVASIAKPASWWTGNQVRYDTYVSLPPRDGLRPGMSAEVEITIAEYDDVLLVPVAAIVETDAGAHCWVKIAGDIQRRPITLGDSNNVFSIVTDGLKEGDEVLLNPAALEQPRSDDPEIDESRNPEEPQSETPTETNDP